MLEQHEVLPIGEIKPVPVNVRVVVATQKALAKATTEGRFRVHFHARLDGLTVVLPPLRARREDIVPSFLWQLRHYSPGPIPAIEAKLVEALCVYNWPLNVRELVQLVRRLVSVNSHEMILRQRHLPEQFVGRAGKQELLGGESDNRPSEPAKRDWRPTSDEGDFEALVSALSKHRGSVARAATAIGISRPRAYRLLAAHPEFSLDDERKRK